MKVFGTGYQTILSTLSEENEMNLRIDICIVGFAKTADLERFFLVSTKINRKL